MQHAEHIGSWAETGTWGEPGMVGARLSLTQSLQRHDSHLVSFRETVSRQQWKNKTC